MPRGRLDGKEKAHSMSIFFEAAATGRGVAVVRR
jgi:hypothetical protein